MERPTRARILAPYIGWRRPSKSAKSSISAHCASLTQC